MIMVADRAEGQKAGGQALLGGLDVTVARNFFGAQSASFEADIELAAGGGGGAGGGGEATPAALLAAAPPRAPARGVFIRAPAIAACGAGVAPLAFVTRGGARVCVAAASASAFVTAFHPELGADTAWHALFARLVEARAGVALLPRGGAGGAGGGGAGAAAGGAAAPHPEVPAGFDAGAITSGNAGVFSIARRVVPNDREG